MKNIHIGSVIKQKVKEKGMSDSEFARRLNCSRSAVTGIYKQKDISTYRLRQISKILGHDFFSEFSEPAENSESIIINISDKQDFAFFCDAIKRIKCSEKKTKVP